MKKYRMIVLIFLLVTTFSETAQRLGEDMILNQFKKPFLETLFVFIFSIMVSLGTMFLWSFACGRD